MKKIILAALLLTSLSSVVLANGTVTSNVIVNSGGGRHISASEVPAPVMATFNSMFLGATNVQWQIEKEHGSTVYQAEFTQNGKRWKAQFAPDGTFLGKKRA
jgi:hypothetical protein